MDGDGAFGAHLACCDVLRSVAEDVALWVVSVCRFSVFERTTHGNQIDEAEDEDDDARADHDAPKRHSERFLACSGFVEVAEHVDTQHNHGQPKSDEAVDWTEQWPVPGIV